MALSPQDIQAFWAAAPQSAQPQSSGGIGGFLARNAGTIGSIALPGIADILTGGLALPADVALSAIGGAGGQAISNAAQHKSLTNDLLGQALSGGAGAVGGRLIGNVGGLLGKAVTKPIDSGVAKAAQDKIAQQAIIDEAPFSSLSKTDRQANDLQGAISNAKSLKLAPTPENMRLASDFATGSNGQGTVALENALKGQKVNVGSYLSHVKDAISQEPVIQTPTGRKLLDSITNNKENNLFKGKGSLTQNAEANDVMKTIRYHEQQAARYANAAPGTEGDAIGKVHQSAANYLKGVMDKTPGVNQAVESYRFNPQDATAFTNDVQKAGGSQELAQHIMDNINNAKSVADLRSFQAPFVRMGKLANAADIAAGGQLTKAAAKGGGGFGQLSTVYEGASALHGNPIAAGVLAAKAIKSPTVADKLSGALSKVRAVNNALPGKATLGKETARIAGQVMNHPQNNSATASAPTTSLTDALSSAQPSTQPTTAPDTSPFSAANIQQAIAADMAMTGGKNVSQLLALYNTFGKPQDTLTTNQKNEVVSQQKALESIQAYAQQLDAAGGAEGPLLGALNGSILGNYTNPAAKGIDAQRIDVASAIAGALNPRGTVSPVTARIIADALPSIHDTPDVARTKLSNLVAQIKSGAFSATTPVTDLTSALGGTQ